jgi:hypothetical protein
MGSLSTLCQVRFLGRILAEFTQGVVAIATIPLTRLPKRDAHFIITRVFINLCIEVYLKADNFILKSGPEVLNYILAASCQGEVWLIMLYVLKMPFTISITSCPKTDVQHRHALRFQSMLHVSLRGAHARYHWCHFHQVYQEHRNWTFYENQMTIILRNQVYKLLGPWN